MCMVQSAQTSPRDYPVTPVPFTAVHVADDFWAPRLETNRKVTVPYDFKKCEETGRIDNFLKAAHKKPGKYEGYAYNDSDVFKVVEGAAYSLALQPDAELARYLDDLIAKFAGAQEPDGYLYAARTVDPNDVQTMCGKTRYSNLRSSHELYNIGHMYEAACAHFAATGKRNFLDIAIKSADHVDREFGPGKRVDPPGHEEIEIGLVKLYRTTGDERYLRLAKFFLDCRGRNLDKRPPYGDYAQDHVPVTEQDHAVGHSVRAGYLYSGMADVAALTGDEAYIRAIDKIWENMVGKRLYITGGIGARHSGEAFGDDYELPNREAYAETCAAIANILWNQRMFLLHGDAKYIDVLERVLYNGFLSGVSIGGDRFFYVNPLASNGKPQRQEWFDCSCCPTNVVRFIPSIPGYVYAQGGDAVYVNLFVASAGKVKLGEHNIELIQETKYPWDGDVKIMVKPAEAAEFALRVRIPGWAMGKPAPGDLYTYLDAKADQVTLKVNGTAAKLELTKGYAQIKRVWKPGDTVELNLPMPVRRVAANPKVTADAGRAAIERGPILYCLEAVDNGGRVSDLVLADDAQLTPRVDPKLLGGITILHGTARRIDQEEKAAPAELVAVPYYAWCHRTPGEMAVWLPRTVEAMDKPPLPASASHVFDNDTVDALSDGALPRSSNDQSIPRFTWWDHKGTTEWVQYDFPRPRKLYKAAVYWFDDTGLGKCRVPASWRLLYKAGDDWRPVQTKDAFGAQKDRFNEVTFESVEATGLRIEVKLQDGFSGGVLEWRIE
ncbi:MAG TPA: glycoside hydrolase family 127 protein [Phycisphaerae bacterium]|nr:glycoside hydrolase family 127 protein [Phycisphaerae bacterium]